MSKGKVTLCAEMLKTLELFVHPATKTAHSTKCWWKIYSFFFCFDFK